MGFRFRVHKINLPGKPDIVLPKYKTAIFVHGCFWHFHKSCPEGRIPTSNSIFWDEKLRANVSRDERNIKKLKNDGWQVLVVWECKLERKFDKTVNKILMKLR